MASAKCVVCGKTAYAAEQVRPTDDIVFHKQCFKCEQCHTVLKLGNYAALDGKYYCKPHYKQLFTLKGNYNEGFGTEKHSANWNRKDDDKKPEEKKEEKKEDSPVKSSDKKEDSNDKKDKKDLISSYEKKSSTTSPIRSSDKGEDTKKSSSSTYTTPSKATSSDSTKSSKYDKNDSEKENNSKTTNVEDDVELKKRLEKLATLESKVEKMLDLVALRKKKIQQLEKDLEKLYKSPATTTSLSTSSSKKYANSNDELM